MSLYSTLFHCFGITMMRPPQICSISSTFCVEFDPSPMSVWVFSRTSCFSPHPKVHMRWVSVSKLSQQECMLGCVSGVSGPAMERPVSRLGACLIPWASGISSSHSQPWTGINRLEKKEEENVYISSMSALFWSISSVFKTFFLIWTL